VNAIESKVNSKSQLLLFSVNAITDGTQAQGEVTMRLSRKGRVVNGVGSDPDIVVAAAKAYLNALNRLESEPRINPQQP
ncbi:MAG: alpha-isopropylmalate synthase regulatory domain-containing protein, partial [Burkholderiaceae bacterium]